jgi:hypothetical protein
MGAMGRTNSHMNICVKLEALAYKIVTTKTKAVHRCIIPLFWDSSNDGNEKALKQNKKTNQTKER